jgi:hypothetical protein
LLARQPWRQSLPHQWLPRVPASITTAEPEWPHGPAPRRYVMRTAAGYPRLNAARRDEIITTKTSDAGGRGPSRAPAAQ